MHEIILCKLGEVVLKGLNRRSFEMKLMSNIRRRTQPFGKFKIYSRQSTIYVEPVENTCDIAGAYAACKQVFGIIAITRALPCEKSKEAIFDTAKTYLGGALTAAKSFKVESKRADKSFPMGSIQLSQWVGGALHDAFPHLTVDVHHPELTVYIEVREDAAYVHGPAESAAGGLPLGMGGHAVSLLSGGIDSPVSSYMIAKRGVQLELFSYTKPMELLADIEAGVRFDVLFLDVLMPGINGINAAREIRQYDTAVQIIFVTSSSEFAVQSYVVGAYYYQLKPIWKDSFFRLTDAVLAECRKRTQHSLILRCKSGVTRITLDSLEYCEVQGRTLVFHLLDGTEDDPIVMYKEKPVHLSRLKIGHRDGKGSRARS